MTVIKICGLSRKADIAAVNEAKPEYCGFIIDFPKSYRNVTAEQVRKLRTGLDASVVPVGVIVDRPVEQAAMLLNEGIVDVIQLHGREDENYIRRLRKLLKCGEEAFTDDGETGHGDTRQTTEIKDCIWKAFKIRSRKDFDKKAIGRYC